MFEFFLFVLGILTSLGETGLYSLFFSLLIVLLIVFYYFIDKSRFSLGFSGTYLIIGLLATGFYSFGASQYIYGQLNATYIIKLPLFFAFSFLIYSLLRRDVIYYVFGVGFGSTIYSLLCFISTIRSPYWWKISAREFVPFLASSRDIDNELGQVFLNSLDPLQSSCLGVSLCILSLSFYSNQISKKNFVTLLCLLSFSVISILLLSLTMQSRSTLLLSILNLLSLSIFIPSLRIFDKYERSIFFLRQSVKQRRNALIFFLVVVAFISLLPLIRDFVYGNSLAIGNFDIEKVERDLYGNRSYLFSFGIISILNLNNPTDMSEQLSGIFGDLDALRTFHNIFIDQYFNSDFWGLVCVTLFVLPVFLLGFKYVVRLLAGNTFSRYNILFLNFFFSFLIISLTSSPFKPVYAVTFVVSTIFSFHARLLGKTD